MSPRPASSSSVTIMWNPKSMTDLPSARPIQSSRACRIVLPRYWIAKSTMLVVPPNAAAIVPDSKSSADVVPPNGMFRCVWTSMPPGITYCPDASMVSSAWNRCGGSCLPIARIVPFSQYTSAT